MRLSLPRRGAAQSRLPTGRARRRRRSREHAAQRAPWKDIAHDMGHGRGWTWRDGARHAQPLPRCCSSARSVPLGADGFALPTPPVPFGLELDRWLFVLASGAVSGRRGRFSSPPGAPCAMLFSTWRARRAVGRPGYLFSVAATFLSKACSSTSGIGAARVHPARPWLEMRARAGANGRDRALTRPRASMANVLRDDKECRCRRRCAGRRHRDCASWRPDSRRRVVTEGETKSTSRCSPASRCR